MTTFEWSLMGKQGFWVNVL